MSWRILISDGFEESGIEELRKLGFIVDIKTLEADELKQTLPFYEGIIVRSRTKVRTDLIDLCPKLKFIGRGGVGLDNIDVLYAQKKGIQVLNTPASSSRSVAELAMAHIFSLSRGLQNSNRNLSDQSSFISLKKELSNSTELRGKTLLLIGMGRIGRALAKMAIGIEMDVIATDPFIEHAEVEIKLADAIFKIPIHLVSFDDGIGRADYISIHSPYDGNKILDHAAFLKMKKGVYIINTSRGENIDESSLINAINDGIVKGAGLDVFENEPLINPAILIHPSISVTPHIGASTLDAQQRIAKELVNKIEHLRRSEI